MDSSDRTTLILATIDLLTKLAIPIIPLLVRRNEQGRVTAVSALVLLEEVDARNAETLRLIAEAN